MRETAAAAIDASHAGAADAELIRAISTRQLTAHIVNVTIGAGIFVLPASVAMGLGAAAPVAYLACAALMALIVLCFAAAGSRVSLTGGLYAYIEVAFGGLAGFAGGVFYWSTACFTVASVATAFAGSLGALWRPLGDPLTRAAILAALFALLALINVRGVTPGIRLVESVTAAKLLPLLVLVGAGLWFVHPAYLKFSMPTLSQVGEASIVLIFAFEGIEVALMPVGEVRDPARSVPRAIFAALGLTTAMYIAIQAVAQGVLGSELSRYADAPLAEAAARVLGRTGRMLVLAGAAVSMFGYLCGDLLSTPRALFALGRDGALPRALARVHPVHHTPALAIVVYAIVAALLAMSSTFNQLAILSNVSGLLLYGLCVAASYELQRRDVRMAGPPLVLPGGMLVQVLSLTGIVWLLSHATRREFLIEAAVLAAATGYFLVRRRFDARPRERGSG